MNGEQKIAVLDISPNSATMLLTSSTHSGHIEILNEFGALTRLTDNITSNNMFPKEAIEKTIDICEEMVNIANNEGMDKIILLATSAIKNIMNKTEFLAGCHTRFNIFPHLLSTSEEAFYTFKGATLDYINSKNKPIIVIEVGEATSEIICGTKDVLVDIYSLRLGSLYLSHLYKIKNTFFSRLHSPLRGYIKKKLETPIDEISKWLNNREPLIICVGNTATTYAGLLSNKGHHSRNSINDTMGTVKHAKKLARRMGKMSMQNRRSFLDTEYAKAEYIHLGIYTMAKIISNLGFQKFNITTNDLKMGFIKYYIEQTKHSV